MGAFVRLGGIYSLVFFLHSLFFSLRTVDLCCNVSSIAQTRMKFPCRARLLCLYTPSGGGGGGGGGGVTFWRPYQMLEKKQGEMVSKSGVGVVREKGVKIAKFVLNTTNA